MLVRFTVENFMSFKERTEFNMLSGDYRRHKHHITNAGGVPLVRAAAIYGANGSGKSNLVKAMDLFWGYVNPGNKSVTLTNLPINFLLDDSCKDKPTVVSAELALNDRFFEFTISIMNRIVHKEELVEIFPSDNERRELIYTRTTLSNNQFHIEFGKGLKTTEEEQAVLLKIIEEKFLVSNGLALHYLVGKGFDAVDALYEVLQRILPIAGHITKVYGEGNLAFLLKSVEGFSSELNKYMSAANIGITEVRLTESKLENFLGMANQTKAEDIKRELNSGKQFVDVSDLYAWSAAYKSGDEVVVGMVTFTHKKEDGGSVPFIKWFESEGTLSYVSLLAIMISAIHLPYTFIVDEIHRGFHPNLLKELMNTFMVNKSVKGQLIFTTHETNLLDLGIFRQDEIWFAQKDADGSSRLYPLSDYENVRHDLDLENGYLNGRFGGVPFLGKLEDIANENAPVNSNTP